MARRTDIEDTEAEDDSDDSAPRGEDLGWIRKIRSFCEDYTAQLLERNDHDFVASLTDLEVMEAEGSARRFSYGVYRVTLSKRLKSLEKQLRRRKLRLKMGKIQEATESNAKLPSDAKLDAMVALDKTVVDLEDRIEEIQWKIEHVENAIECLVERNKLLPGLQGQRNSLNNTSQKGGFRQ